MSEKVNLKSAWSHSYEVMLQDLRDTFSKHSIVLDTTQPHIGGERFLMQAVTATSGKKFILIGTYKETRGIIKITNDRKGIAEIERERTCRKAVNQLDFAGAPFATPPELLHMYAHGYAISIQQFIEQKSTFLERTTPEQCRFALVAFKQQESAHATTFKHLERVRSVFGVRSGATYLELFSTFATNIKAHFADVRIDERMSRSEAYLHAHVHTIDQYCGFLTHTDFVPHNFRIQDETMFLLDYSALTFGNKYEGWARFLNFMTLYNQDLEHALTTYVRDNRAKEEVTALQLMRIYRLGEIIWYYVQTITKTEENLLELNTLRVQFWGTVLSYTLDGLPTPKEVVTAYTEKRDSLRSEEEKNRQKGLH